MGDARAQDLLSLDRDVARGWAALAGWRTSLSRDPDAYADEEPLESVRRVTGKSTWDALSELVPSAADVPLRDALKRWVFVLAQARIGRPDEVAWEREASEARGVFDGHRPKQVSWREAWKGVAGATTPNEAELWLGAAAETAPPLADISRTRSARRVEVAYRFGVEHPWSPLVAIGRTALREAAKRLLDATDDLSRAVWKPAIRGGARMAAVIHTAVARDAAEGWPAQMTARWLEDAFRVGQRGLRIDLPPMPAAFGAASFARALYAFGFAVRTGARASSMPFALAHEPAFVGAHRSAFAFAALSANPEWQGRVLGVGRRAALGQSRSLARSALLDARLHAVRLLLGDDAETALSDAFDELGARLFEGGIIPGLRGAWPRAREDEPARFIGLLESPHFAETLRDRFDSDWYRNPRTWAHFQATGIAPAYEAIDAPALVGHVDRLARAFDGALG
jgi:hypothetical protein